MTNTIVLLILFVVFLLYSHIAVAGIASLIMVHLMAWLIRLNYSIYLVVENIITAFASSALLGLPFGYFFSKRPAIFSGLVSGVAVFFLYYNTHLSHWTIYINYTAVICFFVSFSILGSSMRKWLTNRTRRVHGE